MKVNLCFSLQRKVTSSLNCCYVSSKIAIWNFHRTSSLHSWWPRIMRGKRKDSEYVQLKRASHIDNHTFLQLSFHSLTLLNDTHLDKYLPSSEHRFALKLIRKACRLKKIYKSTNI